MPDIFDKIAKQEVADKPIESMMTGVAVAEPPARRDIFDMVAPGDELVGPPVSLMEARPMADPAMVQAVRDIMPPDTQRLGPSGKPLLSDFVDSLGAPEPVRNIRREIGTVPRTGLGPLAEVGGSLGAGVEFPLSQIPQDQPSYAKTTAGRLGLFEIGKGISELVNPTTQYTREESDKIADEIADRAKWMITYVASLGGHLGPKGLREELLQEASEFGGFGPATVQAAGDLDRVAIEWGLVYPMMFDVAGLSAEAINSIPQVQRGAKALKTIGGIEALAEKYPRLMNSLGNIGGAAGKGAAVGGTMGAAETVGKDMSAGGAVKHIAKNAAIMAAVAGTFQAASEIDTVRWTRSYRNSLLDAHRSHYDTLLEHVDQMNPGPARGRAIKSIASNKIRDLKAIDAKVASAEADLRGIKGNKLYQTGQELVETPDAAASRAIENLKIGLGKSKPFIDMPTTRAGEVRESVGEAIQAIRHPIKTARATQARGTAKPPVMPEAPKVTVPAPVKAELPTEKTPETPVEPRLVEKPTVAQPKETSTQPAAGTAAETLRTETAKPTEAVETPAEKKPKREEPGTPDYITQLEKEIAEEKSGKAKRATREDQAVGALPGMAEDVREVTRKDIIANVRESNGNRVFEPDEIGDDLVKYWERNRQTYMRHKAKYDEIDAIPTYHRTQQMDIQQQEAEDEMILIEQDMQSLSQKGKSRKAARIAKYLPEDIGRSGKLALTKMANAAGLEQDPENTDYEDLEAFFRGFYNAGLAGNKMPPTTIHPDDAQKAYQAGVKDKEAEAKAKQPKPEGDIIIKEPRTGRTEKISPKKREGVNRTLEDYREELEKDGDVVFVEDKVAARPKRYKIVKTGHGWVVQEHEGSVVVTHGGDPRGGGYSREEAIDRALRSIEPYLKQKTLAQTPDNIVESIEEEHGQETKQLAKGEARKEGGPEVQGISSERGTEGRGVARAGGAGPEGVREAAETTDEDVLGTEQAVGDNLQAPGIPAPTVEVEREPTPYGTGESVSGHRSDSVVPVAPEPDVIAESEPSLDENYDLTGAEPVLLTKGQRKSINDQVKAILKKETLTEEDKNILRQYTGEGGLTSGTLEALNQHYTDYDTIRRIFDVLDEAGVKYTNVLEPSVGSGNFVGMRPRKQWTTVDIDKTNHEVVKRLYPKATHYHRSFEEFRKKGFDLIISNVPFSEQRGKGSLNNRPDIKALHDFYFVRSLSLVKDNGVIAFITSAGTMDKLDSTIRKEIISKGDIIGAFRLPQAHFLKNAHTEVITDVIFIQKRPQSAIPTEEQQEINDAWTQVIKDENGLKRNQYYARHPENILGNEEIGKDKLHGGRQIYVVTGPARLEDMQIRFEPYARQVSEVKAEIKEGPPKDSMEFEKWASDNNVRYRMETAVGKAFFAENIIIADSQVYLRDSVIEFEDVSDKAKIFKPVAGEEAEKIRLLDKIASNAGMFQSTQDQKYSDDGIAQIEQYRRDFKKHPSHDGKLRTLFKDANEESYLLELSSFFDKKWNPARVWFEQVRYESGKVTAGAKSSLIERAFASEDHKGRIVLSEAELLKKEELPQLLESRYSILEYSKEDITLQNNILYYSGNVYEKIAAATAAQIKVDEELRPFVDAQLDRLEQIKPEPKTLAEIRVHGTESWFLPHLGTFGNIRKVEKRRKDEISIEWGANDKILSNHLNHRALITRKSFKEGDVTIQEPMGEYMARLREAEEHLAVILDRLKQHILSNPEKLKRVEHEYNSKFRNYVKPDYAKARYLVQDAIDEAEKNSGLKLRKNQVEWIVQALYEGKGINAHDVGGGKTYAAIVLARALKNRGVANKPMFVVPAKTIKKWRRDIRTMYPDAKIVDLGALIKARRTQKLYDLANNNADYTLISTEGFTNIKLPLAVETQYLDQLFLEHLDDPSAKGRQKALLEERIEQYKEVLGNDERDTRLTFDKLGIDMIIADEAHAYKNIGIRNELVKFGLGKAFAMNRSENTDRITMSSARSYDFRFKANYIVERNNGNNVFLLTATPTPNKPMEIYTMLRHIDPDIFEEYGIETDKDFADAFFKLGTVEHSAKGKPVHVLKAIVNAQELRGILNRFIDKIAMEEMPWVKIPKEITQEHFLEQADTYAIIATDLDERRKNLPPPPVKRGQDTLVAIYTGARAASVDPRLYGGEHAGVAIETRTYDISNDKMQFTIESVVDVHQKNPNAGQLIFLDTAGHTQVGRDQLAEDLHTEIKNELIAQGFDKKEVAIINGKVVTNVTTGNDSAAGDRDQKKADIMDAYNAGKIKVVIGSTSSMGEGMDLQVKTTDIYHMDIPYTPGAFRQRNGRGVRYGNQNDTVRVHYLFMRGTFDSLSFDIVAHKKGWNEALWEKEVAEEISTEEEMAAGVMPSRERILIELEPDPLKKMVLIKKYEHSRLVDARSDAYQLSRLTLNKINRTKQILSQRRMLLDSQRHKQQTLVPDIKIKDEQKRQEQFEKSKRVLKNSIEISERKLGEIEEDIRKLEARKVAVDAEELQAHQALQEFEGRYFNDQGEIVIPPDEIPPNEDDQQGNPPTEDRPDSGGGRGSGGGASGSSVAAVSSRASGGYGTIAASEKNAFAQKTDRKQFRDSLPTKSELRPVDEFLKILAPGSREGQARAGSRILRKNLGVLAQETTVAHEALKKAHHAFTFMSRADVYDFIDRMENGRAQQTPRLQEIANQFRKLLDGRRDAVQALGKGQLQNYYENYFPHLWKDPSRAKNIILAIMGKRRLEGSKSFLKKRTIVTIKDGRDAGLELASENPVDLVLLKIFEMDRYIMAQRIIQDLKARNLIKFVYSRSKSPDGYVKVNDNAFTVYMPPEITKKEAYDSILVDQLMDISRSLGIDAQRFTSIRGRRWGYAQKPGTVRTKYAGPESVLIHEIGHVLGFKYNLYEVLGRRKEGVWKEHKRGKNKGEKYLSHSKEAIEHRRTIDKEWRDLADARYKGQEVGPGFRSYVRKSAEKEAVLLEAFVHAPDEFKRVAPTLYKLFKNFLNGHSELRPLLDLKPSLVLGSSDAKIAIPGFTTLGHYYAPETVGKLLNNYLSPGLRNSENKLIAGSYNLMRMSGNILNQAQLAISLFHGLNVTTDMIASTLGEGLRELSVKGQRIRGVGNIVTSPLAPFRHIWNGARIRRAYKQQIDSIDNPRLKTLVEAVVLADGRDRMDPFYYNRAIKNLKATIGNMMHGTVRQRAVGGLRLPIDTFGAALEVLAKPLMEWYVPTGKLGLFAMLAEHEMKRAQDGQINDEQLHERLISSWDSVDNRMGQLVYDNLFWNKTFKDVAMMAVRSVGWNLGSWREYGGVPVDILGTRGRLIRGDVLLSQKMAYTIGAITLYAALGSVIMYILTGKKPEEPKDYFFPKTGRKNTDGSDERLSLPTYAKDWFAYGTQPVQTVKNKLHPLWGLLTDVVKNEDFFNTQIRDPKDPISQQLLEVASYIGKEFLPLSVRNYKKMTGAEPGTRKKNLWVSVTGITSAPSYITRTPAQKLMYKYINENIPEKQRTQQQAEISEYRRDIKNRLRKGEYVDEKEAARKLGPTAWSKLKTEARKDPFAESFSRLSLEQALNVYAIANKEERKAAMTTLTAKHANSRTRTPEMTAMYRELIAIP